mgnify:CR=1 FL=1
MAEVRLNLVDRICETCETSFEARPDRQGRFCSRGCVRRGRPRLYPDKKTKNRAQQLRSLYGLTLAEFDALVESQAGRCPLCENTLRIGGVAGAHVANCNHGLGKFGDNPVALRRAADYLEMTHG